MHNDARHYDSESKEAGWDSPERAQRIIDSYITAGSKVLDIGIGTGQAVVGYADKGATVIGLDHDNAMLEAARPVVGNNGILRRADINEVLPIDDLTSSIDVAQAIGVLEFAINLEGIFSQLHGSLKDNGVLVFTLELMDSTHPAKTHYSEQSITVYRHSLEEVRELLDQTGYSLMRSQEYVGYERDGDSVLYAIFLARRKV